MTYICAEPDWQPETAEEALEVLNIPRTAFHTFLASFRDDELPPLRFSLPDAPLEDIEPAEDEDWSWMADELQTLRAVYDLPDFSQPYVKKPIPSKLRWQIFRRDNYRCVHCRANEDLTVDHIYPEVLGGPATPSNLQTLCRPCNSKKGAR